VALARKTAKISGKAGAKAGRASAKAGQLTNHLPSR
jgi:hypothetical protein